MPISRNQALDLFRSDDFIGLGMEADALRRTLHPEGVVTYAIDRTIHYTNLSAEARNFSGISSLRREDSDREDPAYSIAAILEQIAQTGASAAICIRLRDGFEAGRSFTFFEHLLKAIRQEFPGLRLQCFSAREILALARSRETTLRDMLQKLRDAGLASIDGSMDGCMDDSIPEPARSSVGQPTGSPDGESSLEPPAGALPACSAHEWLDVHRSAHAAGMRTVADLVFSPSEDFEKTLSFFERVRELQDETAGFSAFTLRSASREYPQTSPGSTGLSNPRTGTSSSAEDPRETAIDSLKLLAISRLYLDNIPHLQTGGRGQDWKVLQLSLRFGADDAGVVPLRENSAIGRHGRLCQDEEDLRRIIRDAGFSPVERDALYTTCLLN